MKLDVFGRRMQIIRRDQRWVAYWSSGDGKRRKVDGLVIPEELREDEVIRYVADIFHEDASPEHPDVLEL